jgi:hypothetical protein
VPDSALNPLWGQVGAVTAKDPALSRIWTLNQNDDNPYAWLALAIDAEPNKQFSHARLYYKKLLEKNLTCTMPIWR